jgi:hemoglobin-like flavoprotein
MNTDDSRIIARFQRLTTELLAQKRLGQWHPELVDELYRTSLELEQRGLKKSPEYRNAMSRVYQQARWLAECSRLGGAGIDQAPAGDQADEVIEWSSGKGSAIRWRPEQIDLVRNSFDALWPFRRKLAEQFYSRFFELAPDTRRLFPDDLEKQQLKLMDTLAVRSINVKYSSPLSATRAASTRSLEYRHRILLHLVTRWYGACNSNLVPAFTPEMQQAWIVLYDAIQVEMMRAAKSP